MPEMPEPTVLTDEWAIAWSIVANNRPKGPWSPRKSTYMFYSTSAWRTKARAWHLSWINLDLDGNPIIDRQLQYLRPTGDDAPGQHQKRAERYLDALAEIEDRLGYFPRPLADNLTEALNSRVKLSGSIKPMRPAMLSALRELAWESCNRSAAEAREDDEDGPSEYDEDLEDSYSGSTIKARLGKVYAEHYGRQGGVQPPLDQGDWHFAGNYRLALLPLENVVDDYTRTLFPGALLHQHRTKMLESIVTGMSDIFTPDECAQIISIISKKAHHHWLEERLKYSSNRIGNLIGKTRISTQVVWKQGALTLLDFPEREPGKRQMVRLQCTCGAEIIEDKNDLKPRPKRNFIFSCGRCGGKHKTYRHFNLHVVWKKFKDRIKALHRNDSQEWFSDAYEAMLFLGLPARDYESIHRTISHDLPYTRANAIFEEHITNATNHRPHIMYNGVNGEKWSMEELAYVMCVQPPMIGASEAKRKYLYQVRSRNKDRFAQLIQPYISKQKSSYPYGTSDV